MFMLVFFGVNLFSQTTKEEYFRQVDEFRKIEKIKLKIEKAQEYLNNRAIFEKNNPGKSYDEYLQASNETAVAKTALPESEVFAAINPKDTNNIVISPIMQGFDNGQSLMCPVYYTTNFGNSWQRSNFRTLPKWDSALVAGGGDPVFVYDANGRLFFSWINLFLTFVNVGSENNPFYTIDSLYEGMFYAYSDDGGANFTFDNSMFIGQKLVGTIYQQGQNPNLEYFLDKQWMAADLSNSQYRGNIYLSTLNMNYSNFDLEMQCYTKKAADTKFSKNAVSINNNLGFSNQFGNIDVDRKGVVHATFYAASNGSNYGLYHAKSTNGGNSFSNGVLISKFIGSHSNHDPEYVTGINSQRLYPSPHLAIDKSGKSSDGYLYFTWTGSGITSGTGTGLDIYFSRSTDGGASWSIPIIVNEKPLENVSNNDFYSNITVNPDGIIAIGYYTQEASQSGYPTNYWVSFSYDNGLSFKKHVKASGSSSRFNTIGSQNSGFGIGEYNSILSTKGYVMPVWADGRTNNGNIDIYFAKIPVDGSTSVSDELISIDNNSQMFSVSPNPADGRITLKFENELIENASIKIFNIEGQELDNPFNNITINSQIDVNIDALNNGIYFIEVLNNNFRAVKKFNVVKN